MGYGWWSMMLVLVWRQWTIGGAMDGIWREDSKVRGCQCVLCHHRGGGLGEGREGSCLHGGFGGIDIGIGTVIDIDGSNGAGGES